MKFNMDIKSLVFIITTACIAAGYYYHTEARLDGAEREISFLWSAVGTLQKQNKRLNRIITKDLKKETAKSK
tara:strand:+ start:312 stop:527 length:216 start_codon:yes stop_codon:yes gene_type:complete